MKCPFCNQELEQITTSNPLGLGRIEMAVCKKCMDKGVLHIMPIWDWQELIRAHKALELAITGLKNCKTRDHIGAICRTPEYVDKILEKITALEQKDK